LNRILAAALLTALVTPAMAQTPPADKPVVAPTSGNPNLAVATLKLENGTRLSKLIGSSVYNDQAVSVGAVDDLIMTSDDKVVMAVVSVGGFLGIGSKLVAVPFHDLTTGADGKTVMQGASKDSLNALPNFTFN
jgi:sporulation protein YlmC with PRC-barrel domain